MTEAVHCVPAARVEPQEFADNVKSAAFVPPMATLLIEMALEVELMSAADCEALLEPTVVEENVRLDGLAEMLVEAAPVPVSATICGLFVALSVN